MDTSLIKRRLGWYGLAWLLSFVIVFLVGLVGHYALHIDIVRLADIFIPLGLLVLGLALAGVVLMDFSGKTSGGTKVAIFVLAVLLALPLLWSPVAAMVLVARIGGRSIEYSGAYAQFRITVSHLLQPMVGAVMSGAAFDFVWRAFQMVASFVGFIASLIQVTTYVRNMSAAPTNS